MPRAGSERRKRIRAARVDADPFTRPENETSNPKKQKSGKQGYARDKEILALLDKLQASSAEDRIDALSVINNVVNSSDVAMRRALQSKNIVGLLIQKLTDDNVQVQVDVCGALRNLAIEGGFEICAEMFNKNIIRALSAHLEPLNSALTPILQHSMSGKVKADEYTELVWTWTENLTTLFCCIAESSDKAFRAIATLDNLSTLLYTIILTPSNAKSWPYLPSAVAAAAAQTLYVMTDASASSAPRFPLPRDVSRAAAYRQIRSQLLSVLEQASSIQQSASSADDREDWTMFTVLIIGILQNLARQQPSSSSKHSSIDSDAEQSVQTSLQVLLNGLANVDLVAEANAVRILVEQPPSSSLLQAKETSSVAGEVSSGRRVAALVEKRWTRIRLNLEILAELGAELDGILDVEQAQQEAYEEWHGITNGNGDNVEMDNDEVYTSESLPVPQQRPTSLSAMAFEHFSGLPSMLMQLARPTSLSYAKPAVAIANTDGLLDTQPNSDLAQSAATYLPNLTEQVGLIHARALEALNNLLITIARSGEAVDRQEGPNVSLAEAAEIEDHALALEDDGNDMDSDLPEARDAGDKATDGLSKYIDANLQTFQGLWEQLFQSLLTQAQRAWPGVTNNATMPVQDARTSALSEQDFGISVILGSIWTLARMLSGNLIIGRDESKLLLRLLPATVSQPKAVESATRCIGALGQLASRADVTIEENMIVGNAILAQAVEQTEANAKEPHLAAELTAQALDSVFDIYGDETRAYDEAVFEGELFLQKLTAILPAYRKLVKSVDRRKHAGSRMAAEASLANLLEFIKYRKNLKKGIC